MARSREFHPDEALERAMLLFWKKGYSDTSVDDLVEATGVSRYGLYGTFGDKRQLFGKALQRYVEKMSDERLVELRQPEADLNAIFSYFRTLRDASKTRLGRQGCLLCNTATELAWTDRKMAQTVRGYFEELVGLFVRALTNAHRRGQVEVELVPENAARALASAQLGLAVLVRSKMPMEQLEQVARAALANLRPVGGLPEWLDA